MISTSRDTFLERLRILNNALDDRLLIDQPPALVDHNERARILRNGLAIISFNILEDFIKSRVEELLYVISGCGISFSLLPLKLQDAALQESLKGIQKIAGRKKKALEDYRAFIQLETAKLAGTTTVPFNLSTLGFGWDKSNLDYDDVEAFLKAFHVVPATTNLQNITATIGCSIFSTRAFFQNAASRRHAAAHTPTATSSLNDLKEYAINVKAFALAFDVLTSKATHNIVNRLPSYITARQPVEHTHISLRYIRKVGSFFQEMSRLNTSVLKTHSDETLAVASLRSRSNYNGEMVVVLDYPSKVYRWYTAF